MCPAQLGACGSCCGCSFKTVRFEDSVWCRHAGGQYWAKIIVSAHIDDLPIACANQCRSSSRISSTDENCMEHYLGCEVNLDCKVLSVTLRQKVYAERVLLLNRMWGGGNEPIESGLPAARQPCPPLSVQWDHWPSLIPGGMYASRPGISIQQAFQVSPVGPWVKHMHAAESMLQHMLGTSNQGITYRKLDPKRRDVLEGWSDLDYAADLDSHSSVTGYVMSRNSWQV